MMLKQLEIVKQRFIDIENQLQDMTIVSDHHKLRELSQARSELEPVVRAYEIQKNLLHQLSEAEQILSDKTADSDLKKMAEAEIGDRKSTRLNSSHVSESRMPSSA